MFASSSGAKKGFNITGDLIFKEDGGGDAASIVQLGTGGIFGNVEGKEIHLATMTEGESFGEMVIIHDFQCLTYARMLEESAMIRNFNRESQSALSAEGAHCRDVV